MSDGRANNPGRWVKGQSGNPGGRHKDRIGPLARNRSRDAMQTLIDIMMDEKENAADRVKAACAVLDRAYGKPKSEVSISGVIDTGQTLQEQLSQLSEGERHALMAADPRIAALVGGTLASSTRTEH